MLKLRKQFRLEANLKSFKVNEKVGEHKQDHLTSFMKQTQNTEILGSFEPLLSCLIFLGHVVEKILDFVSLSNSDTCISKNRTRMLVRAQC